MRGVDALDTLPDEKIKASDHDYMVKHQLDRLFGKLLQTTLMQKPRDPLQFAIDMLTLGEEHAAQDPETGLPLHRKSKLEQVFKIIDKDGMGRISLRSLQAFANKYGGETLSLDDLRGLFADFKPASENLPKDSKISFKEFLLFFSKVSATMTNTDFAAMIEEMSS